MERDREVRCRCGSVSGTAHFVSPATANWGRCYCHDCRACCHWLEREDLLDERGGVSVIQIARARFTIERGRSELRLLRLTPKGLHRFYTACCRTPFGNTLPALPFVGLTRQTFVGVPDAETESAFGPGMPANVHQAVGGRAPGGLSISGLAHVAGLMARWSLSRLGAPSPFFGPDGRASVEARVLTPDEREALRRHPRA